MSAAETEKLIQEVKAETDWDHWNMGWLAVFRARGHDPVLDSDGDVDLFVTNPNGHNGPGCKTRGWTRCMHCCAVDQIPSCTVNQASVPGPTGERS